ncbi:LPS translocon maturation chaperone LptM [Roseateles aquae]|uniref:LPS translocon maturation chaperone LptM n=1 Tax=Roseateles aquae TaxID=3077235 RepID=UPI003312F9EF
MKTQNLSVGSSRLTVARAGSWAQRLAPLLLGGALLAGCGQKGPLVLPKPAAVAPAAAPASAPR